MKKWAVHNEHLVLRDWGLLFWLIATESLTLGIEHCFGFGVRAGLDWPGMGETVSLAGLDAQ